MRPLIGRSKGGTNAAKPPGPRRLRRFPWLRGRRGLAIAATVVTTVAAGAGIAFELHHTGRLDTIVAEVEERAIGLSARLGLVVEDIEVEGRAMTGRDAILHAMGATRGTPLFAVSPSQAKTQLEALPWVRSAAVERRLPDTL
ncbi:MAG TPA: FtsQ-type POTRA domain-containing protein, partial [Stellaceae bacterium]|nr:FtsQ-type POTRA domain-containing protein [Stellaceae bacterium]